MHAANRFEITTHPDHFVLRLGMSPKNGSAEEFGEEVASIVLPLTTAAVLAVALFEEFYKATPELQRAFERLQPRIAALNALDAKNKAKQSGTP